MYSFERLVELFSTKGFVTNNIFALDGFYRLVEIVNFRTAASLLIYIENKYRIESVNNKREFKLIPKAVDGTNYLLGSADEAMMRTKYQEIDHIEKALQDEARIQEIYDKPISLKGEEEKSQEKFSSTIRQLKRFKLCVKNIPYKFALFDEDCMCLLNPESELESYFIEGFKNKKRKIYVITSLTNFFTTDDVSQNVSKIFEQFYSILQTNQKIETQKVQAMIDAKRNITDKSKKIIASKDKLFVKIQNLHKQHSQLIDKEKLLAARRKELRKSGEDKHSLERITAESEKNNEQQTETIRNIIDSRGELDEICLVVDNLLFDNTVMLNKIAHNFTLLDKLKL